MKNEQHMGCVNYLKKKNCNMDKIMDLGNISLFSSKSANGKNKIIVTDVSRFNILV